MHKRVYTQTFGVAGALIVQDGRVLLVKEGRTGTDEDGQWNHPVGWIEVGASPLETVIQEVKEETGYDFEPTGVLGVYSLVKKDRQEAVGSPPHAIKVIYTGQIPNLEQSELTAETVATSWFSPQDIENMDNDELRDLDIKTMVRDYQNGRGTDLDFVHHRIVH